MKQTTQLLKEALSPLYEPREVRAIIRLLLEEVCQLSYTQIVMRADSPLPDDQRCTLTAMAAQLRQGIPVQQVLGYAWFCGRRFRVTPDVLIPRPETEQLINIVVDKLVDNRRDNSGCEPNVPVYNLVDIGTGSGCIALTLAAEIHHSFITAVDLSTAALAVARDNAKRLALSNVRFVEADILKEEAADFSTELSTSVFDAIVSNPPYVCQREAADMEKNVLEHEPHLALFVPDDDPLLFYRAIARFGLRHLRPGGILCFEINAAYGPETCQLLTGLGYQHVELHQDFVGRDRFVTASNNY